MTRLPHEPLTPEERELADRLARLGAPDGPSPALDARILAAAHDAVAGSGADRARRTRWPVAMGVAATLVLAIGIAWQLRPVQDTARTYAEVPAAAPASRAPVSGAAELPTAGIVADEAMPLPEPSPQAAAKAKRPMPDGADGERTAFPRQADQAARKPAAADGGREGGQAGTPAPQPAGQYAREQADAAPPQAHASGRRASEQRASAERTTDEAAPEALASKSSAARQAQAKQATVSPESRARGAGARGEAITRSAPPSPPAPAAAPTEVVFDLPPPPAAAPASVRAATGTAAAARVPAGSSPTKRTKPAARSDAPTPARIETTSATLGLERDNAGFTDQVLDEQPPATADSPQVQRAWLQRIRELLADGDTEGARASLAEFKRRYPRYALPDDLREFAPPPAP